MSTEQPKAPKASKKEKKPKIKIEKIKADQSIARYDSDLQKTDMTMREARYVVDTYGQLRDNRIVSENRIRAIKLDNMAAKALVDKAGPEADIDEVVNLVAEQTGYSPEQLKLAASFDKGNPCEVTRESVVRVLTEPHSTLTWIFSNSAAMEGQLKRALEQFAMRHEVGRWALSIKGIGPVYAATLLAYIDMEQCPTVGHIWSFCGMNPNQVWLSSDQAKAEVAAISGSPEDVLLAVSNKFNRPIDSMRRFASTDKLGVPIAMTRETVAKALARRPYNAKLKTLAHLIGEQFKCQGDDAESFYAQVYRKRKAYEQRKNEAGDYAAEAAKALKRKADHAQAATYRQGKLPNGHIDNRAVRYTAKLFLAHWHTVAYRAYFGTEPPLPYPIAMQGHAHIHQPPHASPMGTPGEKASQVDPILLSLAGAK